MRKRARFLCKSGAETDLLSKQSFIFDQIGIAVYVRHSPDRAKYSYKRFWSSSQNNIKNVWNQNFDNGNQNDNNKNNDNNVRAVRGFTQDKRNVTVKLTGENVPRKEFFPVFWQEEPFQILFSHLGNLDLFLFTI